MQLTQLGEEDLEAVVTCINIAFSETMAIFNNVHIRRTSRKQLEECLQQEKTEMWGYRTNTGEIVAVVFVCYDTGKTGHVDMLSVIPEYMGLGLSSGLLRNSEYLLHEAGKSEMTMKVFLSRDFAAHDFEKLGYSIVRVDPWREMKDVLKPEAYDSWVWVTLRKSI